MPEFLRREKRDINFSSADGVTQIKNLKLPFKADHVLVKSITFANNNYIFINSFPALCADFIKPDKPLATYSMTNPGGIVYPDEQLFPIHFQNDDYGRSATFFLKLLTSNGLVDTTITDGSYVLSLEFLKCKKT